VLSSKKIFLFLDDRIKSHPIPSFTNYYSYIVIDVFFSICYYIAIVAPTEIVLEIVFLEGGEILFIR
jgi:hypothetical protein